jgi:phosphinothricin acetyltransferase
MLIRPATPDDVPALTHIYNTQGVATTASYDLEDVDETNRLEWLHEHIDLDLPVVVAELDGRVVGYATYSPFRVKPGYRFTVEHSIYVDGDYHKRGIGEALMEWAISSARDSGIHVMVGVLDAANVPSISLHEKLGFVSAGIWKQVCWKFGAWHDVALFTLILSDDEPVQLAHGGC